MTVPTDAPAGALPGSYYEPLDETRFRATHATSGPWSEHAQHGGPPAALLGRALESVDEGTPRVIGRFTMDLLGPVPVADLTVTATVLRPGRTVSLRQAELSDDRGRVLARAQAWAFPVGEGPGRVGDAGPLGHTHADGRLEEPPSAWTRGYLDSLEWRWVEGAVTTPGPAVVWMRPLVPLVPGETMTPLQRLLTCVDSANGAASAVDPTRWTFLNTELTVHLVRPLVGEWVCLSAQAHLTEGAVGLTEAAVHDEEGLVARSAQALLVTRARG
ncbi:thioesterase family protein [Nocardioides korecus]